MRKCLKITILGIVQGVGYRDLIKQVAGKGGIEGSIQNMEDGSVMIYACGLAENLDKLIDILYKGTSNSKVENVAVELLIQSKDFRGVFRIIGFD